MDKTELYKKIQEIRVALQEMDLTKSGYNKFSDYKYFELSDFLPRIKKWKKNRLYYISVI